MTLRTADALIYTLDIIQQPVRARACGFGDKDRRPLSPPPIVRLRVFRGSDELDPSDVQIYSLILMVDLWSATGDQERNVVQHHVRPEPPRWGQTVTPLIRGRPATEPSRVLSLREPPRPSTAPNVTLPPLSSIAEHTPSGLTLPSIPSLSRPSTGTSSSRPSISTASPQTPEWHDHYYDRPQSSWSEQSEQRQTSYSRVLVGSLSADCKRLTDEEGEPGLFFFPHDLGVRTEGVFTLKFSLVDVSPLTPGPPGVSRPILAECRSDPFTVYSAKRFPGVLAPTILTQTFASQNIRLPTRQKRTREESVELEGAT